jgi:hypothetical protein
LYVTHYPASTTRHCLSRCQVIGVGDRPSDLRAYAAEGLRAFMVSHLLNNRTGGCEADLRRLWAAERQVAAVEAAATSAGTQATPSAPTHRSSAKPSAQPPLDVLYFTDDASVHAQRYGSSSRVDDGISAVARPPHDGLGAAAAEDVGSAWGATMDDAFWRELRLYRPGSARSGGGTTAGQLSPTSRAGGAAAAARTNSLPPPAARHVPPVWEQIAQLLATEATDGELR